MISRTTNPNAPNFPAYGGSGIGVCRRWTSFDRFLADMGPRPPSTSLDRIDNSLGYSPGNCRWANPTQQALNRISTHFITLNGETKSLTEWARVVGISDTGMLARIRKGEVAPHVLRPSRRPRDEKYAGIARERLAAESQGLSLRDARAGQIPMFGDG